MIIVKNKNDPPVSLLASSCFDLIASANAMAPLTPANHKKNFFLLSIIKLLLDKFAR